MVKYMGQGERADGKKEWVRLSASSLEADIAYFDARLALLDGQTTSFYKRAEAHAYRELGKIMTDILAKLRG
ncbi:fumarate hydratase [Candidatus Vondammii sp. HM_W22]|uniref:fumarate hydratase n=1 Tax=Candidatus Vondammii sp. HM_W22 TaxID=2687299 RepID=UPI001F13B49D|nr:fumarate hydratase [Candidatus Vondammii sp. HM_W22]